MSLFSKEKFDEMDQFLVAKVASINGKLCCESHIDLILKVNHNLNFVLCMESQAALEKMNRDYPFVRCLLFVRSA